MHDHAFDGFVAATFFHKIKWVSAPPKFHRGAVAQMVRAPVL